MNHTQDMFEMTLTQIFLEKLHFLWVKDAPFFPNGQKTVEASYGFFIQAYASEVVKYFAQFIAKLLVIFRTFLLAVLDHIIGKVHEC